MLHRLYTWLKQVYIKKTLKLIALILCVCVAVHSSVVMHKTSFHIFLLIVNHRTQNRVRVRELSTFFFKIRTLCLISGPSSAAHLKFVIYLLWGWNIPGMIEPVAPERINSDKSSIMLSYFHFLEWSHITSQSVNI